MYVYIQHEWTHTQCTYARVYIQIHTYVHVHTCMYTLMATHGLCEYNIHTIHVLMRDKKEGRKKQARLNSLRWDLNPQHSTL